MPDDDFKISGPHLDSSKAQQIAAKNAEANLEIFQEESADNVQSWLEQGAFNPILMTRRFEDLASRTRKTAKENEAEKTEKRENQVVEVEQIEELTEQYLRKNPNPELEARSLMALLSRVSEEDSPEEILKKVLDFYPDYSLADEALDYLLTTTRGELTAKVRLAKEYLDQMHRREVVAGKNIAQQAREFSQKGLGSPTALRDLYRDITGNPRDPQSLFAELSNKFDFKKMRTVVEFIFHALGSDLKAKGSSIDRGELHRLLTEGRSLQAILGVYYFFKSRMPLIQSSFKRQFSPLPPRINFELLAKLFVRFLQERYPSADKILQMAEHLNLLEDLLGQIVIYTQMRDAVRYIAPRLFKSEQHRHDVLSTFIDAIVELDDQLDKQEEEEEEKRQKMPSKPKEGA